MYDTPHYKMLQEKALRDNSTYHISQSIPKVEKSPMHKFNLSSDEAAKLVEKLIEQTRPGDIFWNAKDPLDSVRAFVVLFCKQHGVEYHISFYGPGNVYSMTAQYTSDRYECGVVIGPLYLHIEAEQDLLAELHKKALESAREVHRAKIEREKLAEVESWRELQESVEKFLAEK